MLGYQAANLGYLKPRVSAGAPMQGTLFRHSRHHSHWNDLEGGGLGKISRRRGYLVPRLTFLWLMFRWVFFSMIVDSCHAARVLGSPIPSASQKSGCDSTT